MKKLILASMMFGIVGCSAASNEIPPVKEEYIQSVSIIENTQNYSVDLNEYPNPNVKFDLEKEFEYVAVEKYGTIAFKAIDVCYTKYEHMMDGEDSSSDYGSTLLNDMNIIVSKCVEQSLEKYPVIPENKRISFPREYMGLELDEIEKDGFDDVLPVAEYDKSSSRYKELKKICEENNVLVPKHEFNESVEFCIRKGM